MSNKFLSEEQATKRLVLEGDWARAMERRALTGVDPRFSTPNRRRNLIRLALRDGLKCAHCGIPVVFQWMVKEGGCKKRAATFDHIIPASQGGTYELNNGLLSCKACNSLRGHMPLVTFQARLATGLRPRSRAERTEAREARREARSEKRGPQQDSFLLGLAILLYLLSRNQEGRAAS